MGPNQIITNGATDKSATYLDMELDMLLKTYQESL